MARQSKAKNIAELIEESEEYFHRKLTVEKREKLDAWVSEKPENKQFFDELINARILEIPKYDALLKGITTNLLEHKKHE